MNEPISTETRRHKGCAVTLNWYADTDTGAPWDEHDGHGIVSEWTRRDKAPGERVLCADRSARRYYDFAASVRRARRDGWDAPPYDTGTPGERAARAVERDFEFLRRWCADEWQWVGYTVKIDGADPAGNDSLWGIDSDSIPEFTRDAFASAFKFIDCELAESHDAACRDIETTPESDYRRRVAAQLPD